MESKKFINRDKVTDAVAMTFPYSVEIPEKFMRTEFRAAVVVGEDEAYELPVVDMANLLDPMLSASETAKLGSACRDWGFFQLTNHGADEAVVQQMKDSTKQFFSLPVDSKNAVAVRGGGFQGFGYHINAPESDKQDWSECLLLDTQPVQARDMEFWPANPPTFRHALDKYSAEMAKLARRLLGFMANDLGVSPETLLGAFGNKRQTMGIHLYPPCRHPDKAGPDPAARRRHAGPADQEGRQVVPRAAAAGRPGRQRGRDVLEVLSNGAYGSAEHRVVPHAERARTTVVVLQDASVDGMVAPLPELLFKGDERRYKSIERLEFSKGASRGAVQGTKSTALRRLRHR